MWRTRGGDEVTLSACGDSFKSYNHRTGDDWLYANSGDGLAGEFERQTFTYPSTEDLVELVRDA